ncbi:spore coat protein GerQ [Paenibacillus chartarius]|uniref:Spore coat protein GerQ n=1 Tax=Paenibacillus chartarius TaxID=747481 RepID=A0ABV6DF02_9BACL
MFMNQYKMSGSGSAFGAPSGAGMYPGYPGSSPGPGAYPSAGGFPGTAGYPGGGGFTGAAYPPGFPGASTVPGAAAASPAGTGGVNVPGLLPIEESYIENILRLNLGKIATIYMTFENNTQWNAKVFKGRLEAAGRDHIIISDPQTGMRFLLLMVNLDYITFDEELNYHYPFGGGAGPVGGAGGGSPSGGR